jgi:hypothetical protein
MQTLHNPLLATACNTLVALVGLEPMWQDHGPTPRVYELRASGELPPDVACVLRAACDVWDGSGRVGMDELIHVLDREQSRAVCMLIGAIHHGPRMLRTWIERHQAILEAPSAAPRGKPEVFVSRRIVPGR